ncbi:Sedlin [Pseudoneurospora amorphoporcata]|uniref:Sedlin n=1 Tax=Pseudoneurospora amorphoporcata TaxID=241081 RepID=A0AAN6SI10_9PEZI|nr:Sedlin [Pseudoneurospora amorphoporcata]
MSYYFAIIGTQDNPLFEYDFGTSKQGGDGIARFTEQARQLNQFIIHSSLDIVEEVQWTNGQMYLKLIDRFFTSYISCFLTASNIKFLLLHQPPSSSSSSGLPASSGASTLTSSSSTTLGQHPPTSTSTSSLSVIPSLSTLTGGGNSSTTTLVGGGTSRTSTSIAANPTSPQTEEAIRNFFTEVYENYVKAIMSPFYKTNMEIRSPVFRARVAAAGRKYL